jgi:hypothetical protein
MEWCTLDSCGSGKEQEAGSCEYDNEPSGSIKYGKFHDELRTISFSGETVLHGFSRYICDVN